MNPSAIRLPTPLALALKEYRDEAQPFRKVHRLVDAVEVVVKLHTAVLVSQWVAAEDPGQAQGIRGLIAAGLRTPSLGVWWQFAREVAKALRAGKVAPFAPGLDGFALDGGLWREMEGNDNLIALRNGYAHGATPKDEACTADIRKYGPRLEKLAAEATGLGAVRLVAVLPDGSALEALGEELRPVPAPAGSEPGKCYLLREDGALLSLHPLLVYRPGAGRFFFYNDLRKNAATVLNYEACLRLREAGLRDDLLSLYPIDRWQRTEPEAETFRERIEALTEVFKGRVSLLSAIVTALGRERGFLMLWGPPGVGKSAVVARAVQVVTWPEELRRQTYPGLSEVSFRLHTIPYFIRRGQETDSAETLLDNLNQRLEARWRTGIDLGTTRAEKASRLKERLSAISPKLAADERLVLMVDGLDEGTGAEGLLESLPKEVPAGVLVVYSSRENPRVRGSVWEVLDRERREALEVAGLDASDVRALLQDTVDKYALEAGYVDEVVRRSGGNPLYLKLLCDGLFGGTFRLNDRGRLPASMEEIYAEVLRRIEGTEGALDVLCLLAAARAPMTRESIASALERDAGQVASVAIPACAEVLQDDPLTEVEDWQLFHESLRDHLRLKWAERVEGMEVRLAAWCAGWKPLARASRTYALRYAVPHALAARQIAVARRDDAEAGRLLATVCSLLDDELFREEVFLACGNALPLQRSILQAQRVLAATDREGKEIPRIVRWTLAFHGDGYRLYERQLARLDELGRTAEGPDLEPLADLAGMGTTPRDRVMLVLRSLRAKTGRRRVPPAVDRAVRGWLEEAADPALEGLWEMTKP